MRLGKESAMTVSELRAQLQRRLEALQKRLAELEQTQQATSGSAKLEHKCGS